jgi:excinuclease ABC subunit C
MIEEQLKAIPPETGVYIFKDSKGQVLYVGKAVNLRSRVRSYFQPSSRSSLKARLLAEKVASVEFILTQNEVEALVLECNLIKRYRPPFNIRLRDDKQYPYIKITWHETFPRILVTRRMEQDGSLYFGPYTSTSALHQTMDLIRKIFPYATCSDPSPGKRVRPCLYYDIGRCVGPCTGEVSPEEYRAMVEQIILFLKGRTEEIIAELRAKMEEAASALAFEKAAAIRDQIFALEKISQHQRVVSPSLEDKDFIAYARSEEEACVQVFFVRNGKLVGREYFLLEGAELEEGQILGSFLKLFYQKAAFIPPEVIIPEGLEEATVIEEWLTSRRGGEVKLRLPRDEAESELLRMASHNAAETLEALRENREREKKRGMEALAELEETLDLPRLPVRIECYDVSHIQGKWATGSMVVFVNGSPRKGLYRRFRIKEVEGIDDYAMLKEVLERRFRRYLEARDSELRLAASDEPWPHRPDLVLVDGGKGQLGVALKVLEELGIEDIPVAALAKREEEIFVPGSEEPVKLPQGSKALSLLQRIRDEAHRFAISYHHELARKETLSASLEAIPEIGPKRRRALLEHFGSLEALRKATVEEIASVPGITPKLALRIKEFLQEAESSAN